MEIEFLKDYEEGKKTWKKGIRVHVTRERAKELEKAKAAVVIGSESNRYTQDRTAVINAMISDDTAAADPKPTNPKKEE